MLSLYAVSLVHCLVSIKREIFIQILMCTLGSLSHNRLLLDHENNSNSAAEGLKENVSVVLNLVHVVLTRLNGQLYTVKAS